MSWQIAVVFSLTATAFFTLIAGYLIGQDRQLKASSALKWFLYAIAFLTIVISVATTGLIVSNESAPTLTDISSLLETEYLLFIPFIIIAFAYAILMFLWYIISWLQDLPKQWRNRRR